MEFLKDVIPNRAKSPVRNLFSEKQVPPRSLRSRVGMTICVAELHAVELSYDFVIGRY